jgi:N-acetylneuraminate 9-O-acetyltransferase
MICAFLHPLASRWLAKLDDPSKTRGRRWLERSGVLAATLAAWLLYYRTVYTLPKLEYNAVHPYTSWIPLTLWIVVRNLTPGLRLRALRLFGWLGTITLETYLCQFHVWLRSEVPDGQPKLLLALVPSYPLVNFAVTSGLYIFVSHRFFELTNALKDVAVPHDDDRRLLRNGVLLLGALAGAMVCGWAVRGALGVVVGTTGAV